MKRIRLKECKFKIFFRLILKSEKFYLTIETHLSEINFYGWHKFNFFINCIHSQNFGFENMA
jgi:hypothetical protein